MHTPQPRFFFNGPRGPSTADKLLTGATRLKIDIWRFDRDDDSDDEPRVACDVELQGSFPLTGESGGQSFAMIVALLRKFQSAGDGKGGEHV
jgi:hypothetical protein